MCHSFVNHIGDHIAPDFKAGFGGLEMTDGMSLTVTAELSAPFWE